MTTTYTYDSNGLRTSKTTGDDVTEYTYLGSSLVYQVTNKGQSDEESLYFYYDDTGLAAFYYESAQYPSDNGIYHYVKDAQGNIWGIVDNKGTRIAKYEFSAYGEYRSRWSPEEVSLEEIRRNNRVKSANPFDYRGYYYDEETGLYYCQSRYYDPVVDRFLNADTTDILVAKKDVYDKNLFAYCDNNPVVRYDTGGEFWDTLFDVVSLVTSVVDVIKNPSDPMAWVGLAADVVSLALPGVTGGSAVVKAVSKADDVVDTVKTANKVDNAIDAAKTAKKGWKVGDDVATLTKAGNSPTWSTVRRRHWKNEAFYNPSKYSNNLNRMKRGLAPLGDDGFPMELHHTFGRKGANFYIFEPLTRTDHMYKHYGR